MTSRRTTPSTGGLSNPAFKYTPADSTNLAERFKQIRAEQAKRSVVSITRAKR